MALVRGAAANQPCSSSSLDGFFCWNPWHCGSCVDTCSRRPWRKRGSRTANDGKIRPFLEAQGRTGAAPVQQQLTRGLPLLEPITLLLVLSYAFKMMLAKCGVTYSGWWHDAEVVRCVISTRLIMRRVPRIKFTSRRGAFALHFGYVRLQHLNDRQAKRKGRWPQIRVAVVV